MSDTMVLDCGHESQPGGFACGYGTVMSDVKGSRDPIRIRLCYDCCAAGTRMRMIELGTAMLYLVKLKEDPTNFHTKLLPKYEVTDWPGRLRFKVHSSKQNSHNWGELRVDVWFNGPDGHVWHGYSIGHNTQIAHCQRTKRKFR